MGAASCSISIPLFYHQSGFRGILKYIWSKNQEIRKLLAYKVLCIAQLKNYCKYSECLEVISGDFNSVKTF